MKLEHPLQFKNHKQHPSSSTSIKSTFLLFELKRVPEHSILTQNFMQMEVFEIDANFKVNTESALYQDVSRHLQEPSAPPSREISEIANTERVDP